MKFDFHLTKDETWTMLSDLHFAACYYSASSKTDKLYFLSWGLFWIAILFLVSAYISGQSPNLFPLLASIFLALAFIGHMFFNSAATSMTAEAFKSRKIGNEGNFSVEIKDDGFYSSSPSGEVFISSSQVVLLALTKQHLHIYSAIWGISIPAKAIDEAHYKTLIEKIERLTNQTFKDELVLPDH